MMFTLSLFFCFEIPGVPFFVLFRLWFNIKCIFGATDVCGAYQLFTAWTRMFTKTALFISIGLLLRYAEGANLYAILVVSCSYNDIEDFRLFFFVLTTEIGFQHLYISLARIVIRKWCFLIVIPSF